MKWMFLGLSTCCVIFLCAACTRFEPVHKSEEKTNAIVSKKTTGATAKEKTGSTPTGPLGASASSALEAKPLFSKEVKESLFFAASLERESLRLISRNLSMEPTTLFSVLSYAFEIASGTKRSSPRAVDCGRYQIEKTSDGTLNVFKTCQKPFALIATVRPRMNETELDVTFKIKEWASVVGMSVTLTNPDVTCLLRIQDKKLAEMNCENWSYFLSASDASATEIRLKTMSFRRNQELQLKLSGGFYRDLVERKKIDITVPLQGKIKLIEKELEVKDDFADKVQTSEEVRGEKEKSKEVNNPEARKENSSENGSESSKENSDYQKWIQEGVQGEGESIPSPEAIPQPNQQQEPNPNTYPETYPAYQTTNPIEGTPIENHSIENQVPPSEVLEGESSGGVPQFPPVKNRGR